MNNYNIILIKTELESNNNINSDKIIKNWNKNYYKNEVNARRAYGGKPFSNPFQERIKWYMDIFREDIEKHYGVIENKDQFIINNGYMLTIKIDEGFLRKKNQILSDNYSDKAYSGTDLSRPAFNELRRFYNIFSRKLTNDRNILSDTPHPHRLLIWSFMDVNATKYTKNPSNLRSIHVHAYVICPPEMRSKFEQMIKSLGIKPMTKKRFALKEIHIEKVYDYGLGLDTLPYVISYASKFVDINTHRLNDTRIQNDGLAMDMDYYPRFNKKTSTLYN